MTHNDRPEYHGNVSILYETLPTKEKCETLVIIGGSMAIEKNT
ncbi:hypothetical protein [Anaerotignum propionicum]|nr:hypothetical protein [Anaerotignum propionicum]MCQ4936401.1 hypothetical protein [Anaerotignum propionicum]